MIRIVDKKDCCGCGACVQRCPKQCIRLCADSEGFLYPQVDESLCIDCGLCEKVCPELHPVSDREPLRVYAAKARDHQLVKHSSSGGVFTLLAEQVLAQGGVVFGAAFDSNWDVCHTFTESSEGLEAFRRSKYVQSRIGQAYRQVESFLEAGRQVLFTGTPCQVKGLKLFLKKEYPRLLAVDIACHGVPSPAVWNRYLDELIAPHRREDIASVNFRDKADGWEKYRFTVEFRQSSIAPVSMPASENVYMKAFLADLMLRPSCHDCCAKIKQSFSDMTIADFWGIRRIAPEFYDADGVSIVLCRTPETCQMVEKLDMDILPASLASAALFNGGLDNAVRHPHPRRAVFFRKFSTGKSCIRHMEHMLRPSLAMRVKFILKRLLSK